MPTFRKSSINFSSHREAEGWFNQVRRQWVIRETSVTDDPKTGYVVATAEFLVERGSLVPAGEGSEDMMKRLREYDDE